MFRRDVSESFEMEKELNLKFKGVFGVLESAVVECFLDFLVKL